jgi:hypothetical protein
MPFPFRIPPAWIAVLTVFAIPAAAHGECQDVPGDIDLSGVTNVSDVQCCILVALGELAEDDDTPGCAEENPDAADLSCDGETNVTDVLMSIQIALGATLDLSIDADQDGCHDECEEETDPCLLLPDSDADGVADSCDPCPFDFFDDLDADGVCGDLDLCPGFDDAVDENDNGIPDACEVPECAAPDHLCGDETCIDVFALCDDFADCADGSDEDPALCDDACPPSQIPGCDEDLCLFIDWLGDGICDDNANCEEHDWDGGDCLSGGCPEGQLACIGGDCYPAAGKCDGLIDCPDATDEDPLLCGSLECGEGLAVDCSGLCFAALAIGDGTCDPAFDCELFNYDDGDCDSPPDPCFPGFEHTCPDFSCIPLEALCNGFPDCPDGSDELAEACDPNPDGCDPGFFACAQGGCVADGVVCDGVEDCVNGSDEENCGGPGGCAPDEFSCGDALCIDSGGVCDGVPNCPNGADEQGCGIACSPLQFTCPNGACITNAAVCDGVADCADASDESPEFGCQSGGGGCDSSHVVNCMGTCTPLNWLGDGICDLLLNCATTGWDGEDCDAQICTAADFTCENGQCIPADEQCDSIPQCLDSSDEIDCATDPCEANEFACDDGSCIFASWVCDAFSDCPDGSDEADCGNGGCESWEFQCAADQICLLEFMVCDGINHCSDGADEDGCGDGQCTPLEFTCNNADCVPSGAQCNGVADCADGSDELLCAPGDCDADEFDCDDGGCVPTFWVCDGVPDCSSGLDEVECGSNPCLPGQIQCLDGACIFELDQCDGFPDCADGSDEAGCP